MGAFDDLIPAGNAPPKGYTLRRVTPADPAKGYDLEQERYQTQRAPYEVEKARTDAERALIERDRAALALEKDRKTASATDSGEPVPAWAAAPYEKQIGVYSGLAGSASAFQDDFAGNTLTGGLENTVQGLTGFGTEGQRDWWANFRRSDNAIRNELFGATLTPSEQASYAATSINERMDPAEVRRNLQSRRNIVSKALGRKTAFLRAQGYSGEAIDALAGEYAVDFQPGTGQAEAGKKDEPAPVVGATVGGELPAPPKLEVSADGSGYVPTADDLRVTQLVQDAFNKGASKATLNQILVQYGHTPFGDDIDADIANRDRTGALVRFNPPSKAPKGPSALGSMASTPFGSYVASAGNALTAGTLDEIVGMTGGDQVQAQQAKEAMRDANPLASLAGEVAGGVLAATGVGRLPGMAGRALAGDVAYGAAYGAGETNEDRIGGAATGAGATLAASAGLRALGGVASRYRARGVSPERVAGREVYEAGQRQGIDALPADVGGSFARRLTGAAGQGPLSAIPIIRGSQRVSAQAQDARDRIASDIAAIVDPEQAGQAARAGADAFIGRTAARARSLYNQSEALASGVTLPLTQARQVLDQNINELGAIPGGADGLAALQALRQDMDGEFTVAGIRGMRTQLRDRFIGNGLRGSDLERRVNQVIDAASDDVAGGLAAAGRQDAASAYRTADRYWRARVRTIDTALEPVIGKPGASKSGEKIIGTLQTMSKGDSARLAMFVRALPDNEQAMVRSTFISQLGRGTPGTQNAAGDAFSLPQFLTQWNRITPGAKATLFTGESRAALDDLARVAEGSKQAQRFQNFSNTSGGIAGQIMLTGGAGMTGGPLGLIVASGAQYISGAALASPRFARWLARAPRTGNLPRPYIDRLQRVATADASIAAEMTGLREALLGAANDNTGAMTAAVASPGDDEPKR